MGSTVSSVFRCRTLATSLLLALAAGGLAAQVSTVDLATLGPGDPDLRRIRGSVGNGRWGVPLSGGLDVDGDGFADSVFAAFTAAPGTPPRNGAGEIFLVFGDGTFGGEIDTAAAPPAVLRIWGDQDDEVAGNAIWMADVTGDGLGDLLVCRQAYSLLGPPDRPWAGALSIVVGGPALRTLAQMGGPLDLRAPAAGVTVTTAVGATGGERFAIWVRTGDVTGDGVDEMVVGADQRGRDGQSHSGAAYLIRGGSHLAGGGLVDLAGFDPPAPGFPWAGQVARIDGPAESHAHFGATVQLGDLDGNGFAEVLVAAALNRAGAAFGGSGGHGNGGTLHGTLYVFWDDRFQVAASPLRPWHASEMAEHGGTLAELPFTDPWPDAFVVDGGVVDVAQRTVIDGAASDDYDFGEEILGGEDYDGDGAPDLFVGDLTGVSLNGSLAGLGYVLFDAASLRGRARFSMDPLGTPPPPLDLVYTVIHGPEAGAIAADTAMHGDLDGDGIGDLAVASPHASPLGRPDAGTLHVLFGKQGAWPAVVDLAPGMLPAPPDLRVAVIYGALGTVSSLDKGDVLAYSGDVGDLDADGRPDLIFNEMMGNGTSPSALDVGNLLLLSGTVFDRLFWDGFESGDLSRWAVP